LYIEIIGDCCSPQTKIKSYQIAGFLYENIKAGFFCGSVNEKE